MNFKGGFGGANMQNLLKQAQKMQEEMAKKQEEVANSDFTGSVAGGMVEVIMQGNYTIKSLKINPEAVDVNDIEMLEDMIKAAMNEALNKINKEKEVNMPQGLGF